MKPTWQQTLRLALTKTSLKYGSKISSCWAVEKALTLFLTPQRIPTPESEQAWVASGRRKMRDPDICTYEWGPEAGPVVLLIHGWSGRGTQLGAFMEPLVKKGFRVVAMDGPAHGESGGERTNVGDFSDALVKVQRQLGPLHAAIGHSFGAGCLVLALSKGMQAEKLVLIGGPADYGRVVSFFTEHMELSARASSLFRRRIAEIAKLENENFNVGELGQTLKFDAMIVHDEGDKEVLFRSALELKAAWPKAKLLATKGLGHRRIMRDAEVVKSVVNFIADASAEK